LGNQPGLINRKVVWGTNNFTLGPAMTISAATSCLEAGIELADLYASLGYGLLGTGEMGIGNSTAAAAIAAVFTGRPVEELTGRGTGIDDAAWEKKVSVIKKALAVNQPDPGDALGVLAKVGGAEIGGIAGLILGAAARRVPVVIDGFISTAGALIACNLAPATADYLFAGHKSRETGHEAMLAALGQRPILDLDLRLGEGTGAALAMTIMEGSVKIMREMATFAEAGVSSGRSS
jgi:nicotinate-nucleotide--dimethylbenzimidazole phosphoribosyltransferase